MVNKGLILSCICLLSSNALSQVIDNTASFRITPAKAYIRLHYENDYFSGSDEYYTQGINLEFVSPVLEKNPLSRLLLTPKENANQFGMAVEHNAYTPTSIRSNAILYNDRPFAAALMIKSFGLSNNEAKRYRITSSLSLGMIGPVAGAHEIQRMIHRWINDTNPQGWQYQIKNDLIINYEASLEKNLVHSRYFILNGFSAARVGTLNTRFSLGSVLMLGKLNSSITSLFTRNTNSEQKQKFSFQFYAQPLMNLVLYDATLEGGMIFNRDSPYTLSNSELNHFTFQGNTGIIFTTKTFSLEYFQSILSKEFNSGHSHRWGGIRIGVLF